MRRRPPLGPFLWHDPIDVLGNQHTLLDYVEADEDPEMLVTWGGRIADYEEPSYTWEQILSETDRTIHPVTREEAEAAMFFARTVAGMDDSDERWDKFCLRLIERKQKASGCLTLIERKDTTVSNVIHIWGEHRAALMTASELTHFHGAPMAHIVAYEEHLRLKRIEHNARRALGLDRRWGGRRGRA